MPERVAVNRIIIGKGEGQEQVIIEPGTRFNTDEHGFDEATVKRYDETGVTREPRDENKSQGQGELSPREESEQGRVTEGRSPVADSEPGTERTIERPASGDESRAAPRRGRTNPDDL
jgi:hypothetical protein